MSDFAFVGVIPTFQVSVHRRENQKRRIDFKDEIILKVTSKTL